MKLNGGIISSRPSRRYRGAYLNGFWFDTGAPQPIERVLSGVTSGPQADKDAILTVRSPAVAVDDFSIPVVTYSRTREEGLALGSSNPAVAQVQGTRIEYVSNGSAVVTVSSPTRSVQVPVTFASRSGQIVRSFSSWVSGSAAHAATHAVDSRIAGKSPASALRIFTVQNHAQGVYQRNPDLWCGDLGHLTCISPWNSAGGATRAGTLISPRHVIFAAHYQLEVGSTVRFVKLNGEVVDRQVAAKLVHPAYSPHYPDLAVALLDSDVPTGIEWARILPAGWATRLPSIAQGNPSFRVASLTLDQEEKALVTDLYWLGARAHFIAPTDIQRLAFYEEKVGGDSGNPAFLILNGQFVLITVWTYGGAGSGTFISDQIAAINAMMAALGGGYQLTEADLTGFPNYPV